MSGPAPRRHLVAPQHLIGPLLLLAAVATACGQGYDRAQALESFRSTNPDVTADQAGCVVDQLIDRYGLDGLADQLEAGAGAGEAFIEAQYREMFACGVEGDVATVLAEQLEASGVSAEDAPCVADELTGGLTDDDIDVLLSGEITEDFAAKFAAAMESCGALTPEG